MDTPSLDLFATNINLLLDPVNTMSARLKSMAAVQPGAFYQADQMRATINGDNADGGTRQQYRQVATDLSNGLTNLRDAIKTLSAAYQKTEDYTTLTSNQVSQALNGASGYFSGIISDTGGSGSGGSTPPPAGG